MTETNGTRPRLEVWSINEKEGEKGHWTRIGRAFVNRDGSMNLLLDALPALTNKLHVREYRPPEERGANGTRHDFETLEVRS